MAGIPDIANWASIGGAVTSLVVLIYTWSVRSNVRRLQNSYFELQRLPRIGKELDLCKSNLFALRVDDFKNFESREDLIFEVERSIIALKSIEEHIPSLKKEIKETLQIVKPGFRSKRYPNNRETVFQYYLALDKISTKIGYIQEDRKKGVRK